MSKDKIVELNEEQLKHVVGGATIEEIYEKIDNIYGWIPEDIRTKLKKAYESGGAKAVHAYGNRIFKNRPECKKVLNLFPSD